MIKTGHAMRWIVLVAVAAVVDISGAEHKSAVRPRMSLIRLIAEPEAYNGMVVSVVGYINTSFEDEALYLSREDYENSISENSVILDLPLEGRLESGQYVEVEGVFEVYHREHTGQMGRITSLTRVEPWRSSLEAEARRSDRRAGCW